MRERAIAAEFTKAKAETVRLLVTAIEKARKSKIRQIIVVRSFCSLARLELESAKGEQDEHRRQKALDQAEDYIQQAETSIPVDAEWKDAERGANLTLKAQYILCTGEAAWARPLAEEGRNLLEAAGDMRVRTAELVLQQVDAVLGRLPG